MNAIETHHRPALRENVLLAPYTTLGLGGAARYFGDVTDRAGLRHALSFAAAQGLPLHFLGGGSNVVVADAGLEGVCLRLRLAQITCDYHALTDDEATDEAAGIPVRVRAEAGVPWDALVAQTVTAGLSGLECLSGIPGDVGAVAIQNVGAYGCEVGPLIEQVEVLELHSGRIRTMRGSECDFGYRDSLFRRTIGQTLILAITFRLAKGAPAAARYAELRAALARAGGEVPSLSEVRAAVLGLRRGKSMVVTPEDPHSRSVGSFFQNPIVTVETADEIAAQWATRNGAEPAAMPRFAVDSQRCKIPAAWLIEQAGFSKGQRRGAVGISENHALALVHYGGGTTAQLLDFAEEVQVTVAQRFAVQLHPEPVFMGFVAPPLPFAVLSPPITAPPDAAV